jgi:hypothetical protein
VDADFDEFYNVEFNNDETDTAETDIEFWFVFLRKKSQRL